MFSRIAQVILGSEQFTTLVSEFNNTRWLPNSVANLMSLNRERSGGSLHTYPSSQNLATGDSSAISPVSKHDLASQAKESNKRGWSTIVTVIIVEAKGLPDPPGDGSAHQLYCKLSLGSETSKSKTVQSSRHPEWREKFKLHLCKDHVLRVSLWDKGKSKNFMGSCIIDLSSMQKERTHEIWQELDDGFGAVHLNVTMCTVRNNADSPATDHSLEEAKEKYALFNLCNLQNVGQLHVKVIGARGLNGKPYAYTTLEVGNEKVQTHSSKATAEPVWNKSYVFNVNDVSNTLEVKVFDNSLVSTLMMDCLGKISIPLLRIQNGEQRWYALKDRNKRGSARGNCPRILLEMSLVYNPVKAALRLFEVAEAKHVKKKSYKFDPTLVYGNLVFTRQIFTYLIELDKCIRQFLEWDNRELSTLVLVGWLLFWYNVRPWMIPLLVIVPFIYFWFTKRNQFESPLNRSTSVDRENGQNGVEKSDSSFTSKIQGIPELTLFITQSIEYMESVQQRIINLVTFTVPFYSYSVMVLLAILAVGIYFIPFNYLIMMLGLYKYLRKYLDPNRILNNDLLDFINRVPDNDILKDWEELSVPEPHHHKTTAGVLVRSQSNMQ